MIKRSLLWVLASYCIGIVFRDRLKWMLWAVLFSCIVLGCKMLKSRYSLRFPEGYRNLHSFYGNAGIRRYGCGIYGRMVLLVRKRKAALLCYIKREKYFLMFLLFVLLAGAFWGKLQAADYPIDAVLTEKKTASAEGRICSITETKSGYRLELNHIRIVLADSAQKPMRIELSDSAKEPSSELLQENASEQSVFTRGKLLVYCTSAEGLKIGNDIRLEGKAVPLAEPENAGQFDERAYYRAERICCKFNADEILVLSDGVNEIREGCRTIRSRLDSVYEEILPQKHAGIVSAILLGDKAELDAGTKVLYQKNGIAHVLAISGLHVSLLGMGLFALIRKCGSPLIPSATATMLILIFYGCLTEFSVSTQRAVGMLVIAMFARILGRSYDSRSACALCGLIILIVNPMQLYQAGFQLSFSAAFGISYFGRELEQMKLSKGKTLSDKLKVALLSGLTTQLIAAPIVLNCFYELPVYSVFLNLPVIGMLSSMVFLSILAGIAGVFSYSLGKFLAGGVYIILEFYEALCRLTEKLPCPIWLYGKPQGWRILAYFVVLVLFFVTAGEIGKRYRHHPRQHRYRRWAFVLLCLLPLVFIRDKSGIVREDIWNSKNADKVSCATDFLSVGQGDCAVVRSKNGSTYLIDCGSSSVKEVGEYRLKPWLKYHGISKLEAVFLSHPDSDHTNGVTELLEKTNSPDDWYRGEIQIANLVLPAAYRDEVEVLVNDEKFVERTGEQERSEDEVTREVIEREGGDKTILQEGVVHEIAIDESKLSEEKGFAAIYKLARKNGITVLWFDIGDKVTEEGLSFTCLHPYEEYPTYDTNDSSMVLIMECQNTAVLFTGDVGRTGEENIGLSLGEIINKENEVVILKVAHHGSKNSSSEKFLEIVQSDIAVISCGQNNRFGHPHQETLERLKKVGSKVFATAETGTVTVQISENEMVVSGYKRGVVSR